MLEFFSSHIYLKKEVLQKSVRLKTMSYEIHLYDECLQETVSLQQETILIFKKQSLF